jgi:hypothetical protein
MRNLIPVLMLALLPASAGAAERPDWAYPPAQAENVPAEPDSGKPLQAPGSTRSYTRAQIDSQMDSPDWFPDEHAPMPDIVAHGDGKTVRACIGCHLPTAAAIPRTPAWPEPPRPTSRGSSPTSRAAPGAAPAPAP